MKIKWFIRCPAPSLATAPASAPKHGRLRTAYVSTKSNELVLKNIQHNTTKYWPKTKALCKNLKLARVSGHTFLYFSKMVGPVK